MQIVDVIIEKDLSKEDMAKAVKEATNDAIKKTQKHGYEGSTNGWTTGFGANMDFQKA